MPSVELENVLTMLKESSPTTEPTLEEMRAAAEAISDVFALAPDVEVEPVQAAGIGAEWISAPHAEPDRVVLYLHGGGYVMCSVNTHRELASRIARAAAGRVLTVDYRLAPEHPHPAALDDAVSAYRWLLERGVDPTRLVIAGDSAGGGLTVATLVALRDLGEPLPAAAVCLSPWVDLEVTGESTVTKADADPVVKAETLRTMAGHYVGSGSSRAPLASPLYADLSGLPPLLIQVGTAEILLDDATRLAARARQAGVEVTLEPWEDMVHVWQIFAALLPEARQAIERVGEFVRQRT